MTSRHPNGEAMVQFAEEYAKLRTILNRISMGQYDREAYRRNVEASSPEVIQAMVVAMRSINRVMRRLTGVKDDE